MTLSSKLGWLLGRDEFQRSLSPVVNPAVSSEPAAWLRDQLLPTHGIDGIRVGSVVPAGFEEFAKVLHPAYGPPPKSLPVTWSAAAEWAGVRMHAARQWESIAEAAAERHGPAPWQAEPSRAWCPPEVLGPLCETLAQHTSTPELIWYGLWVGFGDVQAVMGRAAHFELPGREYALMSGPLDAAGNIVVAPRRLRTGPSMWWPEDRAWCVATEVDYRWTYVGGTAECIGSMEANAWLEVLRTSPEDRSDLESDWRDGAMLP
jgi:hypothetical protein